MRVRAVVSFSSMLNGEMVPWPVGKVAELPEGVNWLKLGWVVPVEAEEVDARIADAFTQFADALEPEPPAEAEPVEAEPEPEPEPVAQPKPAAKPKKAKTIVPGLRTGKEK